MAAIPPRRDYALTEQTDQLAASPASLASVERIQQELANATSIDDFFGKEGVFARLFFAHTLEQMLDAELTAHRGYKRYAASGRNSGNSRKAWIKQSRLGSTVWAESTQKSGVS